MADEHVETFVARSKEHDPLSERRVDTLDPVKMWMSVFMTREVELCCGLGRCQDDTGRGGDDDVCFVLEVMVDGPLVGGCGVLVVVAVYECRLWIFCGFEDLCQSEV